jgi:hypothetical protein
MSDPLLASVASTSAPAGGPAPVATETPATTAAPTGESTQSQAPAKPAWMAQLPKDLLDDADLSQFDKLDKLARTYKETRGKLSEAEASLAALPKAPEKASDYTFKREGELAEVPVLPGLDEFTAETYHKLGLTKAQAEALFEANGKKTLEVMRQLKEAKEAQRTTAMKALEHQWGPEAPSIRAGLEQVAKGYFGENVWNKVANSDLGNDPEFLTKLAGLQKALSDTPILTGGLTSGQTEPKTVRDALRAALK